MGDVITLSSLEYKNYLRVKHVIQSCVTLGQYMAAINYNDLAKRSGFINPRQHKKLNGKLNDKLKLINI